jgi:hypothetical protein
MNSNITREDVPYTARLPIVILEIIGILIFFIYALMVQPSLRPGLIQLCVGLILGMIFGALFFQFYKICLVRKAQESRNEPAFKWIRLFTGIFTGGMSIVYILLFFTVLIGGIYCVFEVLQYILHIYPDAGYPLVTSKQSSIERIYSSAWVYFITFLLTNQFLSMLWYFRLPKR